MFRSYIQSLAQSNHHNHAPSFPFIIVQSWHLFAESWLAGWLMLNQHSKMCLHNELQLPATANARCHFNLQQQINFSCASFLSFFRLFGRSFCLLRIIQLFMVLLSLFVCHVSIKRN